MLQTSTSQDPEQREAEETQYEVQFMKCKEALKLKWQSPHISVRAMQQRDVAQD